MCFLSPSGRYEFSSLMGWEGPMYASISQGPMLILHFMSITWESLSSWTVLPPSLTAWQLAQSLPSEEIPWEFHTRLHNCCCSDHHLHSKGKRKTPLPAGTSSCFHLLPLNVTVLRFHPSLSLQPWAECGECQKSSFLREFYLGPMPLHPLHLIPKTEASQALHSVKCAFQVIIQVLGRYVG